MTLVLALALDAALGEPRWLWQRAPHPAVLMGRAVGALEIRLNRGANQRLKGVLAIAILVLGAALIGGLVSILPGKVADVIVIAILLAQRSLIEHVRAVGNALEQGLGPARSAVALIVSRDCSAMDEAAIARSAIESAAENQSDGVIAPLFWAAIGGVPGIMAYKMINTADSMIGYRTARYEQFGWAAARLDDLVNLIPARLTALLLWRPGRGIRLRDVAEDAGRHKSPNAGWPEAVLARSLGVALAGPRAYDGQMRDLPWVNATGRKATTRTDIHAAIGALWQCWICAVIGAGLLALV